MNTQRTMPVDLRRFEDIPVDELNKAFRDDTDSTIGVELELMIVDATTGEPLPLFNGIYAALPATIQQQVHGELFACQIEYASRPQRSLYSLQEELELFVSEASQVAERFNARLLWSGNHPTWQYDEGMVRDCDRSRLIRKRFGDLMPKLLTCSVHFHVAVSRDQAIPVVDRMQRFLPLLVALSANSPLRHGEVSGRHSQRVNVWANEFPVCGLSKPFGDWQGFSEHMSDLRDAGLIKTQKDVYYFVRPTRHGTVEIRCCDVPTNVNQIIALAAVVQLLVAVVQQEQPCVPIGQNLLTGDLQRAFTKGMNSTLIDQAGRSSSPMEWLTRLASEFDSTARQLGVDGVLALAPSTLAENGSLQQLRDHAAGVPMTRPAVGRTTRRTNRLLAAAATAACIGLTALLLAYGSLMV